MIVDRELLLPELESFFARYPQLPAGPSDVLELEAARVDNRNREQARALADAIIESLVSRASMSAIRLGDGEGSLMFYAEFHDEFPNISELLKIRICRLMFGRNPVSSEDAAKIGEQITVAASAARYVGTPSANPKPNPPGRDPFASALANPSSLAAAVAASQVARFTAEAPKSCERHLISNRFHVHLMPHYREIVRSARRVSIVTSLRQLPAWIERNLHCEVSEVLQIPGQASNLACTVLEPHWPFRFQEIRTRLQSSDRSGEISLVAGGVLGKIYCDYARRAGAVAIDIGSVAEAWLGIPVRPYHSQAFLNGVKEITS